MKIIRQILAIIGGTILSLVLMLVLALVAIIVLTTQLIQAVPV